MENRKHVKILIPIFMLGFFIFNINNVFAYSIETHAYLTGEIINFYNQNYPSQKISDDLRDYLIDGSRREDDPLRWMNHFYDPIYNRGLTIDPKIFTPKDILSVSLVNTVNIGDEWLSSKLWAQDSGGQNKVKYSPIIATILSSIQSKKIQQYFSVSDFTWQEAIRYWVNGDKEMAIFTLGHILHLIEDKTVPDHTRNDPHPGDSPYELYTEQFTLNNPDNNLDERLKNQQPIVLDDLNIYFDELAEYSNNGFYSKDTIGIQSGYNMPEPDYILKEGDYFYGYKIDNKNGDYKIFVQEKQSLFGKIIVSENNISLLISKEGGDKVISDYWSRLSTKSIQYGAGVINLFFQEVEKAKSDPNFVKAQNKSFLAAAISAFKNFISSGISTISGIFPGNNQVQPNLQNLTSLTIPQVQQINSQSQNQAQIQNQNQNITPSINQSTNQLSISQFQLQLNNLQSQLNNLSNQAQSQSSQQNQPVFSNTAGPISNILTIGGLPAIGGGGGARLNVNNTNTNSVSNSSASNNTTEDLSQSTDNSTTTILTTTSSASQTIQSVNHIVISEIQVEGDGADDEFIEFYNPTNQTISLADFSIQYLSGKATSTEKIGNTKKNFKNDAQIAPYSFYLLAQKDGIFSQNADMIYSFSLSGNQNGASVFLIGNSEPISDISDLDMVDYASYGEVVIAGVSTSTMPVKGQSIERKAYQNGNCLSAQNENEFLGNSCDTDNANDFSVKGGPASDWEIRQNSNPQNSGNLPEPRNKPTAPQNFSIDYSSSTLELFFNWQEAQDYSGSTSTMSYKIFDLGASSSLPIIEAVSTTTVNLRINEVGRDYIFSVKAVDKDGLESNLTQAEIKVPSFIKNTGFYRAKHKNIYGEEIESALIDFSYDQYPFLPLDLVFTPSGIKGVGPNYKTLVFYFNTEAPKRKYLDNSMPLEEDRDKILKVKYDSCGGSMSFYISLIFPDDQYKCSYGGFDSSPINYQKYLSEGDLHMLFEAEAASGQADFSQSDYMTVAFYGFRRHFPQGTDPKILEGGVWSNFELLAIDKTKYYFGNESTHQAPVIVSATTTLITEEAVISYHDNKPYLTLEFQATDADSLDSLLTYEFNYHKEGEVLDENNWQVANKSLVQVNGIVYQIEPHIPMEESQNYVVYFRTKDEFGLMSEIIALPFSNNLNLIQQ